MVKTIQEKITVIIIMSMLMLMLLGVTPVLAEDSRDLIAEPEFVPMLAVTLSPGETTGATSATVADYVYGNLLVNVTEQEIATPQVGEVAPTAGDNLIADYESGVDITAGVAAGKYLQIYDVDIKKGAQIVAFYQAELTEEDIKEDIEVDLEEEPEQNLDEDLEEEAGEDIEEGAEAEPVEGQMMGAEIMAGGQYSYIDENGEIKNTGDKTVTKIFSYTHTLNEGWYILEGNINKSNAITVSGNAHLILADSSSLTVRGFAGDAGINVSGDSSLTIYAQSQGNKMGSLTAVGSFQAAGIGGKNEGSCGKITINGGKVTATGGFNGAGIGGGAYCLGGNIIINGGRITANGGSYAAGIGMGYGVRFGFGYVAGNVTINNGIVTATGGLGGAGIGGGQANFFSEGSGAGGTIIINNNPTVIATGQDGAQDIGNGKSSTGTTILKHGNVGGTDLTYVRLEIQNLPHDCVNKIYCNGQEHEVNSEGQIGIFVEKSTESKNISLDPAGPLIKINPGDVINSRITLDANFYARLVAGFGNALDFPENSQSMINVPLHNKTTIGGQTNFTIAMWIFPKENEPYQTLYRQYNNNVEEPLEVWLRYIKYDEDDGYLYFGFHSRSGRRDWWQWPWDWNDGIPPADVIKIPVNQWTHVALTKSGSKIVVYANGTKYYEMTLQDFYHNAPAPWSGNISFGGTPAENQFFCGRMDEIQFWNNSLTQAEIEAWMYRGIDCSHNKYSNLIYYYKLNQSTGTAVTDTKGSYDGTTVNMSDGNWVYSDIRGWTVKAGSPLTGRLVGSNADGTSTDGINWNQTFQIIEQAKKGTVTITEDNKFEYSPYDKNQAGQDSFTYRVKDNNGKCSNTHTVNIDIIKIAPKTYLDSNGEIQNTGDKTVTKITKNTASLNDGWYIVEGDINRNSTITVNGNAHLILADSSSLTVTGGYDAGINVSGENSLTIYAQSNGDKMGALNAACGRYHAAGIGGGYDGSGGKITINGGKITATGSKDGAGIGGGHKGSNGGEITINGGTVTATGGEYAAGIGGGYYGSGGKIMINGGTVTATGGENAAGIGGGQNGSGGNIMINDGLVVATARISGAGIGGGYYGDGGKVTINGGKVTAKGGSETVSDGHGGSGIGGGCDASGGEITINGGEVDATGGKKGGAGIGGGVLGSGGNIIINGGTLTARGANWGAGIGGGQNGSGGEITINGGKLTAMGGAYGAGIGGGSAAHNGRVTINNGTVTAIGGNLSAGIGGGGIPFWEGGCGGTIIINNNPTVIATGKDGAQDIGNAYNGAGITTIKRGGVEGTDLTYVRLRLCACLPDDSKRISFNEEEHETDNDRLTGFFIEKSPESKNIRLEPAGAVININPGDVQNSRITIKDNDVIIPVAGFGRALNFSANSQSRIKVPFDDLTRLGGSEDFTISMWIFPKENEPYQTLYRQEGDYPEGAYNDSFGLDFRFIKYNDDEGYLYFGFNKMNSGWQNAFPWNDETSLANITKIPMNRWTHVALTKSGKNVILYANGTKYYEMTLDDPRYKALAPRNADISFGGTPFVNQFFSGRMDEIQFWNTALTPAEIQAWMYRGIDSSHNKYNNLIYYYKLNSSSGITVIDSKGSYDGTTVNMTDANWVASDIQSWTVDAGSTLKGQLVGTYAGGSSTNGTNWNLTFEIVEQAKKGTATLTGDNQFEYCTHDMNQEGHDSFTYRVKGPNGDYFNTEIVNIDIIPKVNFGTYPPDTSDSTRSKKPAKTGVEILVNGKSETAAVATTTREGGKTVTTIVLDDKKVEKRLEQEGKNAVVAISVNNGADVVIGSLNGQTVKSMESKDAILEIKTQKVTYTLPASQIDIDDVAEQLGKQVEIKDITVSIKISEPASDTVKIIKDTANKNNYQIVVEPIEFEIACSSGDKTVEVSRFNAYVERLLAIPESVDTSKISTAIILNNDGTFSPVPTAIIIIDGKYYAKINSLSNSIYAVINSPKTFEDVENHWAQKDIDDMASRLIINGVGNDLFGPERSITRAEFSAVMVRALGLRPEEHREDFSDVKAGEWYTEDITTSSSYGLVKGYDDGTFKPNGNITRQEAMAILVRAMDTTKLGKGFTIDAGDILAAFNDNMDVADWARDSVSKCVKTGVVTGRDSGQIAPLDNITRAEAAIMVRRLLINSGLINE